MESDGQGGSPKGRRWVIRLEVGNAGLEENVASRPEVGARAGVVGALYNRNLEVCGVLAIALELRDNRILCKRPLRNSPNS